MIASGSKLAFDEIPGLAPQGGQTQSVCRIDRAETARDALGRQLKNPGPVVIGAAQGASCFGPAYAFLFILEPVLSPSKTSASET